jgi:hypothetical protein
MKGGFWILLTSGTEKWGNSGGSVGVVKLSHVAALYADIDLIATAWDFFFCEVAYWVKEETVDIEMGEKQNKRKKRRLRCWISVFVLTNMLI